MAQVIRVTFLFVLIFFGNANLAIANGIENNTKAQEILNQILEDDRGVGIMAAIYRDGKLLWSGTAGFADLESKLKMQNDHRLRIGSVSKTFTAILALKLAEINKLDLDKPIEETSLKTKEDLVGVTPRLLGSHLAGIRHYDFSNFTEANNMQYFPLLKDSFGIYEDDLIIARPKTRFLYTSIGFNLLGAAIENSTQATFSQAVLKQIATPLNLKSTLTDNSFEVINKRGRFYTISDPNPVFPWMKKDQIINTFFRDSSDHYPSGGILSNAKDLARFADSVFNSGFLSKQSMEIITTPAKTSDGKPAEYGGSGSKIVYTFGWEARYGKDGSVCSYGHNGETNGAYALIRYFPNENISVAAIVNYNLVAKEPRFFKLAGEDLSEVFLKEVK